MAIFNNVNGVLHRVRCKLYPNYLPKRGGKYLARAASEACLSIEQVCASLKARGGFNGNYEESVECVRHFIDESVYQVCDGFAVNLGYYTLYSSVRGTFDSASRAHDSGKNPITFRFRVNGMLRKLAEHIEIVIDGVANSQGYIDQFIDTDEESLNGVFVPGNIFKILGHKIKLEGDNPEVGVYFVPVDDPSKAVKVERMPENTPSKIIGVIPQVTHQFNRLEIRTQYTGGSILKEPRVITSDFIIESA